MANLSIFVIVLIGIEFISTSPIYETSPSEISEPVTVTTEEINVSTEIPVPSEKSDDLKSAETAVGFIGIGVPIYGGYYPRRRYWGGYGGWGGGYGGWGGGYGGYGGWGHHHHHHGHFGHGHGWRG